MYGITEVRINLNRFKEATLGINHVEIREQEVTPNCATCGR